MDLANEINDKQKELNGSIHKLADNGKKYAENYRNYRILLAKELLRLKADGMPVTIAYDIARGEEKVANAKYGELCSEAVYRANLEAIQATKLQLKILENQYDKEFFNVNND